MPLDDSASPAEPPAWRDDVHPAADDFFPMMGEAELRELGRDILANGLQQPLVFWGDQLLDGRNRLAAVEIAAPPDDRARLIRLMLTGGSDPDLMLSFPPPRVLPEDDDPFEFVVSLNICRRHLRPSQRRRIAARLLIECPERSDRATARLVGASPTTIGTLRHDLEQTGDVSKLDTRTDSIGRQQPATPAKPKTPAEQVRAKAVIGFKTLLHQQLAETLEELIGSLKDERRQIAALPFEKRVALARGCLMYLGVNADDLRVQ